MTDTAPKPSPPDSATVALVVDFLASDRTGLPGPEPLDEATATDIVRTIGAAELRPLLARPDEQDRFRLLLRQVEPVVGRRAALDLIELLTAYPGELVDAVDDPRLQALLHQLAPEA